MSDRRKRKKELFIPDKDTPKFYICKICGNKIIPRKADRYTAKGRIQSGGLSNAISGQYSEPELFDAFDCKVCGCQFIAKTRLQGVSTPESMLLDVQYGIDEGRTEIRI